MEYKLTNSEINNILGFDLKDRIFIGIDQIDNKFNGLTPNNIYEILVNQYSLSYNQKIDENIGITRIVIN